MSPKAAGASYQNKPDIVGTGPFQTVEVKKGDYVRMVANPTFWGQKPTIDEILFVTYQNPDTMTQDLLSGNLDAAWGIPPRRSFPSSRPPRDDAHLLRSAHLGLPVAELLRGQEPRQSGCSRS